MTGPNTRKSPATLSIGMPVHDCEAHLPAALDSLLGQTYQDFEILISDNASTDSTADICARYAARDPRITVVRQPVNIGGASNYNFVAERAGGTYFKWASSNDLCAPPMLETCIGALEANPDCVLAYPESRLIGDRGEVLSDYDDPLVASDPDPAVRFRTMLETLALNNAQNGVLRTAALRRTGLEGVYAGGDIPLMVELGLMGTYIRVPERLFDRRVSPGASTIGGSPSDMVEFNQVSRTTLDSAAVLKLWVHLVLIVRRSDLPVGARWSLYGHLARRLWWGLPNFSRETADAIQPVLSGIFPASGR